MQQQTINISIPIDKMNIILAGLAELPLKTSGDLFAALKQESEVQIKAMNTPPPKAKKPAKE